MLRAPLFFLYFCPLQPEGLCFHLSQGQRIVNVVTLWGLPARLPVTRCLESRYLIKYPCAARSKEHLNPHANPNHF
jgi:hypothetical protein